MTSIKEKKDLGIILTKSPHESSLTNQMLTLATAIIKQKKSVDLFLISDGVWLAKKNPSAKYTNSLSLLQKKGMRIIVSNDHLLAAGLTSTELLPHITITEKPYDSLVDHVMTEWNRVITL